MPSGLMAVVHPILPSEFRLACHKRARTSLTNNSQLAAFNELPRLTGQGMRETHRSVRYAIGLYLGLRVGEREERSEAGGIISARPTYVYLSMHSKSFWLPTTS